MELFLFLAKLLCAVTMLSLLAMVGAFGFTILSELSAFRTIQRSTKMSLFTLTQYYLLASTIIYVCVQSSSASGGVAYFLFGFGLLLALAAAEANQTIRQIKLERENSPILNTSGVPTFAEARFRWLMPIQIATLCCFPVLCFFSDYLVLAKPAAMVVGLTEWTIGTPLLGWAFSAWVLFSGIGILSTIVSIGFSVFLMNSLKRADQGLIPNDRSKVA